MVEVFEGRQDEVCSFVEPASKDIIFVFSGAAERAGIPLGELHQYLRKYGANVVYLRDKSKLLYLNGLSSLKISNLGDLVGYLKELIPSGVERIHCIGSSGGGFAGLYAALKLGATSVILFGGVTDLTNESLLAEKRGVALLNRIINLESPYKLNLANLISPDCSIAKISLWYGEKNIVDARYAKNITLVPQVINHPVAGTDRHDITVPMRDEGLLESALDDHFEGLS
ncbi:hypothetical protein [Reinekea marinisedimentorum]|uniref:Uncharacterized protein n=1 Tax=Reinekea marinisedimentorum TaxID=230495 RepID=A0A4R3I998_9GAMM|nr:hypothetical protein [Reinekea marinisedimentorum]TCS41943.1 hypothetical protein BCF53_10447 [Reinekea marinisedimentorum]